MTNLLALIAALLPTYLIRFEISGVPSTALELLIYVVFAIGLVKYLGRNEFRPDPLTRRVRWLVPPLLLFLGATIGVAMAPDAREALGLWKGFIVDPILVYVLVLAYVDTEYEAATVVGGLFIGMTALMLWGVVEGLQSVDRVVGPFSLDPNASPNYLAFAVGPIIPLTVWLATRKYGMSQWNDIAGELIWVLGLSTLFVVWESQSRAGLIAAGGALTVTFLLSRTAFWNFKSAQRGLVGLMILAVGLSWLAVRPDFSLSPDDGGRITASNNVRWQLWSATGELAQQHWFLGTGLGGFQERFTELTADRVNYPEFIAPKARTPHNLLVGIWMEAGLLGLAGIIAVLILVGTTLFRAVRDPKQRTMAAALLGAWLYLLAHGLVDQPIWKNDSMVLFWLLTGLAASLEVRTKKQIPSTK